MGKQQSFIVGLIFSLLIFYPTESVYGQEGAYMMILLDTSSSMLVDTGTTVTFGDGSLRYPGVDTDGNGVEDDSRLFIAKEVITEVVAGAGGIRFGLARYFADEYVNFGLTDLHYSSVGPWYDSNQNPNAGWVYPGYDYVDYTSYDGWSSRDRYNQCCWDRIQRSGRYYCTTCTGSNCYCYDYDDDSTCDNTNRTNGPINVGRGADILVQYDSVIPYDPSEILEWVDHNEEWSGATALNREIRATGFTPLARSIMDLRNHFRDDVPGGSTPGIGQPGSPPCYRYAIILTDGQDTCEIDEATKTINAVARLADQNVTTYIIAFAITSTTLLGTLDSAAVQGGTNYARVATNRDELRAAFAEIVASALRVEECNNLDDDCDGVVDGIFRPCSTICEDGQQECSAGVWGTCSARSPDPSETCDGIDNDCDGAIDEGLTQDCSNACGSGTEICSNGIWINCSAPRAQLEVCDGVDNDCDTLTDESDPLLGQACGVTIGVCTAGVWQCVSGDLVCSGTNPSPETCNNLDDDCDGSVDEGVTQDCSVNTHCPGYRPCVNGSWGTCTAPTVTAEICNNVDDDCDGSIDEGLTMACSTACGTGNRTCVSGVWSACSADNPSIELCDGLDNDCDGVIDDNIWQACTFGTCSGWQQCTGPNTWGACSAVPTTEICDGIDNDCDGSTDEGVTRNCSSICGSGIQTCTDGLWGTCSAPTPEPEICDSLDNDCDGVPDDGLMRPCSVGTCTGEETCTGGIWGGCTASSSAEVCDNVDNNCNGVIDDGLTRPCTSSCGSGTETCSAGIWGGCTAPQPAPESCDNVDNDCDGTVDEGLYRPCYLLSCTGEEYCSAGNWIGCTASISTEICDGIDNDCNGTVDDGLSRPCSTACGTGTETCAGGGWTGCTAPQPEVETCDGVDNDCDGTIDEGVSQFCTVGTCSGIQYCDGAGNWLSCQTALTAEVCNGADDDCDGEIDEGLHRTCSTVCGVGTQDCVGGSWDTCTAQQPVAETCNAIDDDCDGLVDEGLTQPCSTICGSGAQTCVDGLWGPCSALEPTTEVCDGFDNDCDGTIDEDDPDIGEPCGTDVGVCTLGYYDCVGGVLDCIDDVEPSPEICDGLDNDCDTETDEGLPLGQRCDNETGLGDTGQCEWGHFVCDSGDLICEGFVGPSEEVCDCVDNDCDGSIDENIGGDQCGINIGTCEFGLSACVNCQDTCVGNVEPTVDICDGLDNDCDGVVDEDTELLCPDENNRCIEGQCAFPCADREFQRCPLGKVCIEEWCVGDPCINVTCGNCETCDPNTGLCKNVCEGHQCAEGLECKCGRCVPNNCYYFDCPEGQVCIDEQCVDHPCDNVECEEGSFCHDGECISLCDDATCGEGSYCVNGQCVPDPCVATICNQGYQCNRETGECTQNCIGTNCGPGKICDLGTGDCVDDPCSSTECPDGYVCQKGNCIVDTTGPVGPTEDAGPDPFKIYATGGGGIQGCGNCQVSGSENRANAGIFWFFVGLLLMVRRRLTWKSNQKGGQK